MEVSIFFRAKQEDYSLRDQKNLRGMLEEVLEDFYDVRLDAGFEYIPIVGDIINLEDPDMKILKGPEYWYDENLNVQRMNVARTAIYDQWVVVLRRIHSYEIEIVVELESKNENRKKNIQ